MSCDRCNDLNTNTNDCDSFADLLFDLTEDCCEDGNCSDCCDCIDCPKKSGNKCKKNKHRSGNGRCYPSRDDKVLCCDCNGGCKCYKESDRNCFWPSFCHPRWLPCDCLYTF